MSNNTNDPNFRYPNDNRETNISKYSYPSQQEVDPLIKKGEKMYYPNDNGGYYANSNRVNINIVDPTNKKQTPNSNYQIK